VKGGEGQIAQDHFNAIFRQAILHACGITIVDLYDDHSRANLIESLNTRSNQ
jgi:hypothetical protein